MEYRERKLLKTIYEKDKNASKGQHYTAWPYCLTDILQEVRMSKEEAEKILQSSSYLYWDGREMIRMTPEGLIFCQDEFERRGLGFLPD